MHNSFEYPGSPDGGKKAPRKAPRGTAHVLAAMLVATAPGIVHGEASPSHSGGSPEDVCNVDKEGAFMHFSFDRLPVYDCGTDMGAWDQQIKSLRTRSINKENPDQSISKSSFDQAIAFVEFSRNFIRAIEGMRTSKPEESASQKEWERYRQQCDTIWKQWLESYIKGFSFAQSNRSPHPFAYTYLLPLIREADGVIARKKASASLKTMKGVQAQAAFVEGRMTFDRMEREAMVNLLKAKKPDGDTGSFEAWTVYKNLVIRESTLWKQVKIPEAEIYAMEAEAYREARDAQEREKLKALKEKSLDSHKD